MEKLGFGTAGFPSTAPKKDPIGALLVTKELGLDCLELEFAHGVRMRDETAAEIRATAKRLGITLTAHAPYYINLNAKEQDKIDASINRLLQTARLAGMCGAYSMTFHAAFYMKDDPKTVFDIVKKYLKQITERLGDEENGIHLRPELTGRKSQFGTLEELCELSQEVPQVFPCLDFSHNNARTDSEGNNYDHFAEVFERYRKALGKGALSQMHIHVAGIQYGSKGEIKHLSLKESEFNYTDFLRACRDFNVRGAIICESPELEKDALLLKHTYEQLLAEPVIKNAPVTKAPKIVAAPKTSKASTKKSSPTKAPVAAKGKSAKSLKTSTSTARA